LMKKKVVIFKNCIFLFVFKNYWHVPKLGIKKTSASFSYLK